MRILNSHEYEPSNTIVIAGSPRSGTTWLAQSISAIPGAAVLFEPDHVNHVPLVRRSGLAGKTYVPPGTDWPEAEHALDQMLRGRVLNAWTVQEIDIPKRVKTWIVKFVRLNRLLPWLTERFPVRTPVLIVRHPCAVVASQISAGWTHVREHADDAIQRDFPEVNAVLESIETPYEQCAARWAIDTLIPLSRPKPHPWITVSFESLVAGSEAFAPLFERWGIAPPRGLERRMREISSTTRPTNSTIDPVTSWTTRLTSDQVRSILSVTRALGLDFYGEEPEPDPSLWAEAT